MALPMEAPAPAMSPPVVRRHANADGSVSLLFDCPGCGFLHGPRIAPASASPARACWKWNGSLDRPTLTPSLIVRASDPPLVCHSWITGGLIQFLDDCTHRYAGRTVPLPEIDS